jgi:hypothetical protein
MLWLASKPAQWRQHTGVSMNRQACAATPPTQSLQEKIVELAVGGIPAICLKQALDQDFPFLDQAQYHAALLGLQELGRLVGEVQEGEWCFKTLDDTDPDYQPLEYSPEFAEQMIAASCGEFVEIDVDEFLALLDAMIAEARSAGPDSSH